MDKVSKNLESRQVAQVAEKEEHAHNSNPYRPFDLEKGDWFYLEKLIDMIRDVFTRETGNRVIVLQGNPGSGKSSTLRQIKKSSCKIGDCFVPLYLDLGKEKYVELEPDELLFAVYCDVAEQLNAMGYLISRPNQYENKKEVGEGLEALLLGIESVVESEKTILIIFDEFDDLLENVECESFNAIIEKFSRLIWDWSRYAVILAGDKRFTDLNKSEPFKAFLSQVSTIDVEKFLDETEIRSLIEAPVIDEIDYTEDAVNEILWLSGKNVYFQQLICYYLYFYLKKRDERKCTKEDVGNCSNQILNGERPAFKYAWKRKLSLDGRLLSSALADLSLTVKKGEYYYFDDDPFLDELFENHVRAEIKKLHGFGYLGPIKERRFHKCPFIIPLYGRWVRKEHPFLKTVFENMDKLAPRFKLQTMMAFLKKVSNKDALPFHMDTVSALAASWLRYFNNISNRKDRRNRTEFNGLEVFFKKLSGFLKLEIKKRNYANTRYHVIDIKNLNIGIVDEAFCFFQNKIELTPEDISDIENVAALLAENHQTKLTIFFYSKKSEMVEELVKKAYLSFITIHEDDMKRLLFANRPAETFKKILLSKLTLARISPYETGGPAKTVFYGRRKVIDNITRQVNSSYAIVGSRRIGKSSLLLKISENSHPNTHYVYMDMGVEFSGKKNYKAFLKSMQDKTAAALKKEISFSTMWGGLSLTRMQDVVTNIAEGGSRLVYLMDEVDALIVFDRARDSKLLKTLRALSQKRACKFVFAGFKELYHRKRDIESPLYNFCDEIMLEPLEREPALELITRPMESIGVTYKNAEDRELILEYTANHPSLLQFFCKHLLEKVDEHPRVEERRIIFREDIKELFNTKYERFIMDEVYMFYSNLSKINRLILMLLVEESNDKPPFSLQNIRTKLKACGIEISIENVYRNLRNLVMRFILLDKGQEKYCFALQVFPSILRRCLGEEFESQKNEVIQEITQNDVQSIQI